MNIDQYGKAKPYWHKELYSNLSNRSSIITKSSNF